MVPIGGGFGANHAGRMAQPAQQLDLDQRLETRLGAHVIAVVDGLEHIVVALRTQAAI